MQPQTGSLPFLCLGFLIGNQKWWLFSTRLFGDSEVRCECALKLEEETMQKIVRFFLPKCSQLFLKSSFHLLRESQWERGWQRWRGRLQVHDIGEWERENQHLLWENLGFLHSVVAVWLRTINNLCSLSVKYRQLSYKKKIEKPSFKGNCFEEKIENSMSCFERIYFKTLVTHSVDIRWWKLGPVINSERLSVSQVCIDMK